MNDDEKPISISSEVARMRAHARGPTLLGYIVHDHIEPRGDCISCRHNRALAVADFCLRDERQDAAFVRLERIASKCAELSKQISALEQEALAIADVLLG